VSAFGDVRTGYGIALGFLGPFALTHLGVRLLTAAIVVPATGLVLAAALAASGESAITDHDIARFLLTPAGFAGALALLVLSIMAAILDVAAMTVTLRRREHRAIGALLAGLGLLVSRFPGLFRFGLHLVLRVLGIAAPFLVAGAAVAWLALGRYDINYYLTYRPPAFLAAAGIGIVLLAGLVTILLTRLSGWAIALHLVLLDGLSPARAFAESADRLHGRRTGVVARVGFWLIVRIWFTALVATVAGLLIAGAQRLFGPDLRLIALSTIAIVALWWLAAAVIAALANGALAVLLDRLYREVAGGASAVELPVAAPGTREGRRARLVVLAAAAAVLGGGALGGGLFDRVAAERSVEIIAHRGAAAVRPENTLAAVEKALEDRADWVEIDVQETADGEVVVAHDSDFMKLAGVDLKVWDATMADLAAIDIGTRFGPAYGAERTPTLRAVLEAAKGRGKVLIELKYYGHDVDLEARVARIVEETGMEDAVAVMSLKIPGVRKMHALRPDWPHGILAATAIGDLAALEADFLAVNTGQASLRLIRQAQERGKKLYVWTVDDPLTMTRMISMGVDGLITNDPALARQVMEARNALSAPERLMLWLSDRFRPGSFDLVAEETDA
jgi:glycerophosphoryl diester phosphodiesterase